ncbi:MAG TPA: hypothetical protein PKD10_18170 [Paracoccaceae bacterium]|mgnify:CR=1 FL=1|nr:hypothetical protein [Paracoccaceae bacterium]HMO70247.1 hypothetical protein [Paracoccaceae bacterium]
MRAALEARLADLAAAGKTIGYGALARELEVPVATLTAELEALMAEDAAAGRPFRAALMEGRLAGGLPARGFFEAAAALGRSFDGTAAVLAERAALFAAARSR